MPRASAICDSRRRLLHLRLLLVTARGFHESVLPWGAMPLRRSCITLSLHASFFVTDNEHRADIETDIEDALPPLNSPRRRT